VDARGRVAVEELARLYRTAAALVFPSLYEGFGQPALEAMASGCPAAVSRIGPLEEVCGDAAEYFDPTSPADMAGAVGRVLERAATFAEAGVRRAAAFTWERCSREHEAVYRDAARSAGA
jgi:glycosyltransferase involved in cell wall biosynthesis